MTKGKGKRTIAIEIDANELRVCMFEAIVEMTRPAKMTPAEAWADIQNRSPGIADAADRCAVRAMIVIASAASKGRMVQ